MTRDEEHDQRPDQGRDDTSAERYADLLDEDASLAGIVGALDSLYNQGQPPARVAAEMERAVYEAASRPVDVTAHSVKGPRTTMPKMPTLPTMPAMPRRLSTLAACAAAIVIVGLMAALLHGFGPGVTGPGSGGRATPSSARDQFALYGGIEVVAELACPAAHPGCDLAASQSRVMTIMRQRLEYALSLQDVPVRPQGATRIVADIPGDMGGVQELFNTGSFAVLNTGGTQLPIGTTVTGKTCAAACSSGQYSVMFTSGDLDTAAVQVQTDKQTGQPVIAFAFAGQARDRFAQYTGSHVGQYLTITLDDVVIESAVIQSQIAKTAQLSGITTPQQAHDLAAFMKFGALPTAIAIVSTHPVPPSGQSSTCVPPTPTPMPSAPGTATPTATATPAPSAPANVTPGPQAQYVQYVTTATAVDSNYAPVNPTSTFLVNADVYVVASMRNLTAGQSHTLSIHWFLDGQDLQLSSGALSKTITKDSKVYFSLHYPTAGLGSAKLYFDRPINDPDTDTAYLAATVDFAIQMPSTSGAPLPTPTSFGDTGSSSSSSGPTCPTPPPTPTAELNPSGPTPAPGPTPPPTPTPTTPPTATPGA
jgi:hypothetical protein